MIIIILYVIPYIEWDLLLAIGLEASFYTQAVSFIFYHYNFYLFEMSHLDECQCVPNRIAVSVTVHSSQWSWANRLSLKYMP